MGEEDKVIKEPEAIKETVKPEVENQAIDKAKQELEEKIKEEELQEQINNVTAEKMREMFRDNDNVNLTEAVIQNNEICFDYEGKEYRVRKATFHEKQLTNNYRIKMYIELLKDTDCMLEKDLIALYKKRGIDIANFENQINKYSAQQKTLFFELGKAIKEKKPKKELEKYKEQIEQLIETIKGVSLEKQQLLEFSLENRVLMEVYSYMIWLIAEIKVDEKWVKIWKTYEEFLSATPDLLLGMITKYGATLITEEMNLQTQILN